MHGIVSVLSVITHPQSNPQSMLVFIRPTAYLQGVQLQVRRKSNVIKYSNNIIVISYASAEYQKSVPYKTVI